MKASKKRLARLIVLVLLVSLLQPMIIPVNGTSPYDTYDYSAIVTTGDRVTIPISSLFSTQGNWYSSTFASDGPNPGLYAEDGQLILDVEFPFRQIGYLTSFYFDATAPGTYQFLIFFRSSGIVMVGRSEITIIVKDAVTEDASNITSHGATLNGRLNPHGLDAEVYFEYGTDTGYGTIEPIVGNVTGDSPADVSASIGGLAPNTTYHYRTVADNGTEITYGNDRTFQTLPVPPTVTMGERSVAAEGATLTGLVNAFNSDTEVTFVYGEASGPSHEMPAEQSPVTGAEDTPVSVLIEGLEQNTTYYYHIRCVNEGGEVETDEDTFTTPYFAAAPTASTSIENGTIKKDAVITLSSGEDEAEIYYTTALNDNIPELPSVVDSDHVSNGEAIIFPELSCGDVLRIKAVTVVSGKGNSLVTDFSYDVQPQTPLTLTGITVSDKAYDGNTSAAANFDHVEIDGIADGDEVGLSGTPSASFASASAGDDKDVVVSGYSLTGQDAGYYFLDTTVPAAANIAKIALALGTIEIADKEYDGNTTARISRIPVVGVVGSDEAHVDLSIATAAYDTDSALGTDKPVTVSNIQLAGADKDNYTVPDSGTAIGDITPRTLSVDLTIANKIYDGNTTATITGATWDKVGEDDVAVDYSTATATFNDVSIEEGKPVTVTGLTLMGNDKSKYALADNYTTVGNIRHIGGVYTPRAYPIGSIRSGTAITVVSDLNPDATIYYTTCNEFDFDNHILDIMLYRQYDLLYDTLTVKSGETVIVEGDFTPLYLIFYAAQEFYYNSIITYARYNVTPKPQLSVTGLSAADKVYDGNDTAVIIIESLSGGIYPDSDDVSFDATAHFSDKNVGNGKTVTITGTLTGTDARYYELIQPAAVTASITEKQIAVDSIEIISKVYDRSTSADISAITLSGTVPGDDVYVDISAATAVFSDADYGDSKTVTVTGLSLAGADATNYSLSSTEAYTTGNILPVGVASVPSANPASNSILSGSSVTLSTTTVGADIYFSLDGSDPSNSGSLYADPILITGISGSTITIKALARKEGVVDSAVMTKQYTIAEPGSMIITAEPDDEMVTLSWGALPDVATYVVYSGDEHLGEGISIADGMYGYTVGGLTNGTCYTFTVKAMDIMRRITHSAQVSATPRTVPGAPTNVNASPGNGCATVTFQVPEDDGGSPITGYRVTSTLGNVTAFGTDTPIRITGLSNEISYTFTVHAINDAGNGPESSVSNEVTPYKPPRISSGGENSNEQIKKAAISLPVDTLTSGSADLKTEINLGGATLILPGNMLMQEAVAGDENVTLAIAPADTSGIDKEIRDQIGDRPVIKLSLTVDGKPYEWSNENAPVTVSIPYEPTPQEMTNPEHITVWYIDGKGQVVEVPSGRYDSDTGMVTFSTTHFSHFAVVYVAKTFDDLGTIGWAKKPIEVLASKGILKGFTEKDYSPQTNITRADFLYSLVKALGINAGIEDNFDDIERDAYYYNEIAIAKKLGITSGTGNNKFSPAASITRQDMMTFTGRALKMLRKLELQVSASDLDRFSDKSLVAAYAIEGVASVVKEGLLTVSDKIHPSDGLTRAEAAMFLYRIYNKY